ncbi:uncharacterized protein [Rutidosis leptorrhynchoides]|uniref:uncharacterized protein n=1 Tax=Rutidosis leptorrhynchoides TaxID=125765 RepID=UPI003A99FA0E
MEVFMGNVYAPQALSDKIMLWNKVSSFMDNHPGDFIFLADWNSVRTREDRCGSNFCVQDARVFNDFIENNLKGSVLARGHSDHSPILLFQDKVDFGPTYFKIFESWFTRQDFDSTVRKAWDIVNLNKELDIVAKFRLMKGHLKRWISSSKSNEDARYKEIVNKINDIDISIDVGIVGDDLINERNNLVVERDDLSKLEDIDSFQKSSIKWDIEGDENSKFFHASLKHKRHS